MHPWPTIFLLTTCCFSISYSTDFDYTAEEGETLMRPPVLFSSGIFTKITPDCKPEVEILKNLRETHNLCLYILVLSKMPYIGEEGFYTPTPADQHFPIFWKYHSERCINFTDSISQTTFYNFGDNFPSDIVFICAKPTHASTEDKYGLVTYMIMSYIALSDSRPLRSNEQMTNTNKYCIDGNLDYRMLIPGSRTCMIAVLMDSIVLGHTVFDPFQIEEGSSTKLADYGSSFLELQANYKGCAPQWAYRNNIKLYEDDFIPDGHCNGAMGTKKFDLLCCCYQKRDECAFMPPPSDDNKSGLKKMGLGPSFRRGPRKNTQKITCAIGKFNEKTDSQRRQGPVKEFLSNDTPYCTITFEYWLRDDLLTYDLTYVMGKDDDITCRGKDMNKPFITSGDSLAIQYTIRDKVSISMCCDYTLCNNIAGGFKTDQLIDMPKTTWSPKIGREIQFHCGYPQWDILRYLSKDKTIICPFMISALKSEELADGANYKLISPEDIQLRKDYPFGWCAYFSQPPNFYYGCIFKVAVAAPYEPKEEWMQLNYNRVQRLLRQVKHTNPPMPECRSTRGNLVPLIDFARGNYTAPKFEMNSCFVYMVFDDFGGTMIKAGPCSYGYKCCHAPINMNSYRMEKCDNGFCAQAEYEAVCHPYNTGVLPNIGVMMKMLKFEENTTDIIVAQSNSPNFSRSKKLRVPYYCMFGVLSLCKNKEWHAIHDARTCLTVPIDTYDAQNKNGIRRTTVSHPRHDNSEIHSYHLTCALDKEGKITKTLSADFRGEELSAGHTKKP